jgi:hypothetical protein
MERRGVLDWIDVNDEEEENDERGHVISFLEIDEVDLIQQGREGLDEAVNEKEVVERGYVCFESFETSI